MSDTTEQAPTTGGAGIPGASEGGATPAPNGTAGRTFTQDDVDRLIKERLVIEQQRAAKARAEAEARAAEEAAAKAGEWQTVAEQRESARAALAAERDSLAAERDQLAAVVERQLKARLKALPEELRELVGGGSLADQLARLESAEKAAQRLAAAQTPGTPAGPRGIGGQATPIGGDGSGRIAAEKRRQIGGF